MCAVCVFFQVLSIGLSCSHYFFRSFKITEIVSLLLLLSCHFGCASHSMLANVTLPFVLFRKQYKVRSVLLTSCTCLFSLHQSKSAVFVVSHCLRYCLIAGDTN